MKPSVANPANPPVATGFATGTPGANGLAFDENGNLYVSDGGTNLGRVFRVGPQGGAATELFRVPTMANTAGVGRQNQGLQPPLPPATQSLVANGLAFDRKGTLFIADTARGAIWRVEIDRRGNLIAPMGCDTTYPANTLCLDALFVQHPALDGADGIALDRKGNIYVDPNERNSVAVVDRDGHVTELFRNPVGATASGTVARSSSRRARCSPVTPSARRARTATAATTARTQPARRAPARRSSARCRASTRTWTRPACRCRSTEVVRRGSRSLRAASIR